MSRHLSSSSHFLDIVTAIRLQLALPGGSRRQGVFPLAEHALFVSRVICPVGLYESFNRECSVPIAQWSSSAVLVLVLTFILDQPGTFLFTFFFLFSSNYTLSL